MEHPKFILYVFFTLIVCNMVLTEDLAEDLEDERSLLDKVSFVPCDYSASRPPHRTCVSCNEELRCIPDNIGIKKTCHGALKHCNEGKCSKKPSKSCAAIK